METNRRESMVEEEESSDINEYTTMRDGEQGFDNKCGKTNLESSSVLPFSSLGLE